MLSLSLIMNYSIRARGFLLASLLTLLSVPAHADIGCQFVAVGNPGNVADTTGYGRVDYYYRIGKFEVTIAQYTAFLNAVAATDTYGLYNPQMATDLNVAGISRAGSPGSYTYAVIGDGNRPITYVCWFDAARMANWMHNGQPVGAQDASTTESGAYTLAGATSGIINKNSGALYYIPTEDEWFKAAYHDPSLNGGAGGYWLYPTRANSTPGNVVGPALNQVNYYTANSAPNGILSVTQTSVYSTTQNYLTPGGAFSNSGSAYDTFDQAGNVYELNDAVIGSSRGVRGGTWWANNSGATLQLSKNGRSPAVPTAESANYGFRLAASAAPKIAVEQPAGSILTNGAAMVNFGAVPMGASSGRIFTIRNTGMRGREESRRFHDILAEVKALASCGVKEVTLLGQNVNSYGKSLGNGHSFSELLRAIGEIEGIERIRFTTSHPKDLSDDIIDCFRDVKAQCESIHLPVQSGSDAVLARMNRRYTSGDYIDRVCKLREACPDIAISSDIIVGFPGETEQDYQKTLDLMEKVRFDTLFSFQYSERAGTAAVGLDGKVHPDEKRRRLIELQALQDRHTREKNDNLVGKTMEVLVEGTSRNTSRDVMGRTRSNKIVNFAGGNDLVGKTVRVRIVGAFLHSLRGQMLD